jgi:2-polyprenyl-6-methoxyphenol hydroxylase-like FAD-dependent oxidoreductase
MKEGHTMSSRSSEFDVIVVGAGVGGAAFALALAHTHDLNILVVDRHPGPGNINRGESLLPPVTRLLAEWGALARVRAAGALTVARMQFHHYRAGLLLDVPLALPDVTDPYLVLPHPEIERVLVDAAAATSRVEMRYRRRVVRILEEGARVRGVVLGTPDGGEEAVRARLVVGADGAASMVRAALGITLPRVPYDHALFISTSTGRPVIPTSCAPSSTPTAASSSSPASAVSGSRRSSTPGTNTSSAPARRPRSSRASRIARRSSRGVSRRPSGCTSTSSGADTRRATRPAAPCCSGTRST